MAVNRKIRVYHTIRPNINGGSTEFLGERTCYDIDTDGQLFIHDWDGKGGTKGTAVFAKGVWDCIIDLVLPTSTG